MLLFFFFNDTATTEIYTLSLHDALPIWVALRCAPAPSHCSRSACPPPAPGGSQGRESWPRRGRSTASSRDRKSTRLNSSHSQISYAVFCLKKKKTNLSLPAATCLSVSAP